jgi:hypothetical protein
VLAELNLAKSLRTRIIPVRLKKMTDLPEGFDLFLSGVQWIDAFPPNYAEGVARLLKAIGVTQVAGPAGLRGRTDEIGRKVSRLAHEREIGANLRNYGGAVAGGAVLAAVLIGKTMVEQQDRERQSAAEQRQAEVQQYVERTSEILTRAMSEMSLADGMTTDDYRDEFRPAFFRILGQLDATKPPTSAIEDRQKQLITEMQRLLEAFDTAMRKAESGDAAGAQRAITRLNAKWGQTIVSMRDWLIEASANAHS